MTIVALAGRKGSGKSTLSKYLIENEGFYKISFADYLKDLIINLFLIDEKYVYDQLLKEEKILNIYTDLNFYKKISNYIKEDVTYLYKESVHIQTPRQLLQFIGTDILRKHDVNFHVKKTISKIKENLNLNFVCDDLRFNNELFGLRDLNSEEYFVIRPENWDISNHLSEISLSWFDLKNIIINNQSFNLLLENFKNRHAITNKIVFPNTGIKSVLQFDITAAVPNDAFIGGFICAHKNKNSLKKLEFKSIKEYLINISEKIDYVDSPVKLENLKIWLDLSYPPQIHQSPWIKGQDYYNFLFNN